MVQSSTSRVEDVISENAEYLSEICCWGLLITDAMLIHVSELRLVAFWWLVFVDGAVKSRSRLGGRDDVMTE
jgi:hypothetical protein